MAPQADWSWCCGAIPQGQLATLPSPPPFLSTPLLGRTRTYCSLAVCDTKRRITTVSRGGGVATYPSTGGSASHLATRHGGQPSPSWPREEPRHSVHEAGAVEPASLSPPPRKDCRLPSLASIVSSLICTQRRHRRFKQVPRGGKESGCPSHRREVGLRGSNGPRRVPRRCLPYRGQRPQLWVGAGRRRTRICCCTHSLLWLSRGGAAMGRTKGDPPWCSTHSERRFVGRATGSHPPGGATHSF